MFVRILRNDSDMRCRCAGGLSGEGAFETKVTTVEGGARGGDGLMGGIWESGRVGGAEGGAASEGFGDGWWERTGKREETGGGQQAGGGRCRSLGHGGGVLPLGQ